MLATRRLVGRYQIESELGRGGMGAVFRAFDEGARRTVALKLLESQNARLIALFQREYETLAMLAHPRVIAVHDFGVAERGARYYTMELLDGGDLTTRAPLPWAEVCALIRDVCTSLVLLHAQKLVHRDVNPRNVRLDQQGRAKLIDFGAMAPIGIAAQVIGTPAFMAPEAVYRQALDQRTDLYALGALGYRLLSGRDAYPARRIDQLRDTWRSQPRPLRELVPDVPRQLDELIHQLLSLNPAGRCRAAGEVFVRLSALVGGLPDAHEAEMARAYLAAPAFVGREQELGAVRRAVVQSFRSRGAAVLVDGPPGVGRSRFLDACVLEGQLLGAIVLRARGSGAVASFELLASLAAQLCEARPQLMRPRACSELLFGAGAEIARRAMSPEDEASVQQEMVSWLLSPLDKPLLMIIDDLHLADRASAAVLTRLVDVAGKHRLTVVASAPEGASGITGHALRLVRERASCVTLGPLAEQQSLALVRSLFDDVVNVQLAAKRIFDIARGNPRATVELAEWLVDGQHVVHEGGRWLIPDTLSGLPLPSSVNDALRQRLAGLAPYAIKLAAALAIARDADLPAEDYAALLDERDEGMVQTALAQLLGAGVVTPHGRGYGLAHTAYAELLTQLVDGSLLAAIHRRIAAVCVAHNQADWAIYHLFRGDARGESVDLLLSRIAAGYSPTHVLPSLEERVTFLREQLAFCEGQGRPARDLFALKLELVRRAEIKASLVRPELSELAALYKHLTGYTDWQKLPADLEPAARIGLAIKSAMARYEALPDSQRIFSPREALPSLLEFVSSCLASATANCEMELLEQTPPLAPFAPLSDAIRLMAIYMEAVEGTVAGRVEVASARFIQVIEELRGDAGVRMGAAAERLKRHAIIAAGMLNAGMSRSVALDYADQLLQLAQTTGDPYAKSTSLRIRHQYHLRRGNFRQAQHWQHELELDKLTDRSAVFNPSGIYTLSWIHATVGSVAGMRDCLAQMREYTSVSGGLGVWEIYMTAEYDRLRGAAEQALPRYMAILEHQAGRHMAWLYAAHGVLLCLEGLGRLEEGKQLGEELLARAARARLGAARGLILRPLSLIEARLGHFDQAVAHLDENITQCTTHGMGGINLGIIYEFRARVAIWARDSAAFEKYADLCAELYAAGGGSPDLSARLDALFNAARRDGVVASTWQSRDLGPLVLTHAQVELRDRLADCGTAEARYAQGLSAIVQSAQAEGGHLYGMKKDGLCLLACSGALEVTEEHLASLERCLSAARAQGDRTQSVPDGTATQSETDSTASAVEGGLGAFAAQLGDGLLAQLVCGAGGQLPVGVFVLRPGADRTRVADNELVEVVAHALTAAGDLQASA